ncbi:MAG: CoA transferase [Proteobacteria bacterium]|nr:CoA transferase [Pseudomonadota bacterium]
MFDLLKGIKVIDLTTVALGPYATQMLGDFGADVIKIESKDGDVLRSVSPGRGREMGAGFLNFNRNKRSLVLDLKQKAGQAVLHKLVEDADVLVHNMRDATALQLGASYDELSQIQPDLVYCCSAGFGSLGPDHNAPAYDDIIQARCGLAALNADADGVPQFVRTIICDKVVGLHLALAVAMGLVQKTRTGRGVFIEAPMLETMVAFLMAEHLAGHTLIPEEGELGYERLMTRNRRPFQTRDGYLAILPYTTRHWIRFFQICQLDDWATSELVIDPAQRSRNIDTLYAKIAELAPSKTTAQWVTALQEKDIPCAPVSALDDLLADPHLSAAGVFREIADGRLGGLREIRSPFQVNGALAHQRADNRVAPGLGEHTIEILVEGGYSREQIMSLQDKGVLRV